MSIINLIRKVAVAIASMLLLAPMLHAQHSEQPLFEDPFAFNPDYQFFSPVDMGDFGEKPDHRTGWYGQYRRMYTSVSRPNAEIGNTEGDFTWGNMYDIGFMSESGSGWFVSGTHIDGPNNYDVVIQPRANRILDIDVDLPGANLEPVFPVQERNDILTNARDLHIHQSINVAELSGFELNKIWRLEPLHNGSVIEPFMGVRYFNLGSVHRRDQYRRIDALFVDNPDPNIVDVMDELTSTHAVWENHMVGAQMGFRWLDKRGRWNLSNETRVFGAQNFQSFGQQTDRWRVLYAGATDNAAILSEEYIRSRMSGSANEFVWGVDVRAEAAYSITRDLSLTMGLHFSQYAQGIARGNNPLLNEEDFRTVGLIMGIDLNR
ncbi:MAG: hypothetical protein ACI814_003452 [Mariniblastus sp.]|jgi:hypothetical protein